MTGKRSGRTIRTRGKKSDYKKAIVTLDAGSEIEIRYSVLADCDMSEDTGT